MIRITIGENFIQIIPNMLPMLHKKVHKKIESNKLIELSACLKNSQNRKDVFNTYAYASMHHKLVHWLSIFKRLIRKCFKQIYF